ncbi:MAG: di-trans,poly-cis-decaprenylcistransferase [Candidatus Raymondbacteria bacterium RifOxyA12_full_50_37]|uniref:Isoprenyl transferase n=1 Tax=Candidatus Raymondbacteria bacterium RIFOXYD12_FULL_49_13 TaxID=1817890 RepID=A0A1F7FAA0_UNCRA|nr:MAG: di-trans,poly-cis-decaprenylcistransferase [Candidatus Raymondbacteria bacterium RifOxyA12_full_50_37]OGJ92391.1 MAG: di-trans,poly-cis-decaprenylcistransferase [Candidatus Raymondbacteria bacterium RIFOXYA2_FULL_49_16]OGJ98758.1 MAG: di-trans,poly-cis-decaprenylcistransferase [Candidatus Raymondbacteria bacterium RifOxyB12_full_50_8]OGJ99372.1 MAG: di-trans,poly-cis-decaprenylcistransferase [Candidatus Raymondbacteria bacterium RIFOXYC2_FULL_50_21]OGK03614.1 MAG: di-trans,poly-cis-deca
MTEQKNIPGHIAIILDGNGRWAKKRGRPRSFGHRAGTDATRRIVQYCGELGVRILTIYVFSSENWRRPPLEVTMLMRLLIEMVRREIRELNKNNVRLNAIGDLSLLPGKTREVLEEGIRNTSANTGLVLNLAISYGGRAEIVSAVQSIVRDCLKAKVKPANINEELVGQYLYTAGMPDPDLLIRTGGDLRISNFLLWQCAYTEFYFTPVLWPDFDRSHLDEAIDSFQRRERRFGKIMES